MNTPTSSTQTQFTPAPDQETPSSSRTKTHKKKLTGARLAHLIHSFVGLKLSLLMSIVLITGAIAVFAEELDWIFYEEVRVSIQGEKLNEGEVFDRMRAAMPGVGLASYITANDRERTAGYAMMSLPDGGFKKVWIDPYTGEIQGTTNFLTAGEFTSILHKNLFMPLIGRALVNVFGVLCLIGLITGLIAYPQFWRGFFKLPRWSAKRKVFWRDLHKFLGLWSLWFVLIIGVSGSWWFYQNPLVRYDLAPQFLPTRTIDPGLSQSDLSALGKGVPTPLSSAEIVDIVKAHDPEFSIHMLLPPEHNGMAYKVRGTKHDLLTSKWSAAYFVHPYTGEIIGDKLTEDLSALSRVDYSMVPLHYGTFGYDGWSDLLVKTIWFVFGMAMGLMSISGMIIYYKRTRVATEKLLPKTGNKRKAKKAWLIFRPWGGPMSGFKYLNWAFIAVMCIGISIGFKLQSEGTSGSGYQYTAKQVGPWTISLNATLGLLEKDLDPIQAGRQTNIDAFIKDGDPKAIKFMYVKPRKPRTTRAPGSVIHGTIGFLHAHMAIPAKLKDDAELWLTVEDWQGNFYQTSWPLMPDGEQTIDLRSLGAQANTALNSTQQEAGTKTATTATPAAES